MFRTGFATVLVIIGCLLAGPAVLANVLVGEVTDRQAYLDAVTPLADDPGIQAEVASRISTTLDDRVPAVARPVVDRSINNFVKGGDFKQAWVKVNEEAQPQLIALLRNEKSGAVHIEGDAVTLDLGVVADDLKAQFGADNVPLANQIPTVHAKVQLISGSAVRQVIPAFNLLESLSVWLPIAAIGLIVLGLLLSARRAATLIVAGVGLIVIMLLVVLGESIARGQLAARSPEPKLTGPFFDALVDKVSTVVWIVCGVGAVLIVAGAVLARVRRPDDRPDPYDGGRYGGSSGGRYGDPYRDSAGDPYRGQSDGPYGGPPSRGPSGNPYGGPSRGPARDPYGDPYRDSYFA